MMSSMFPAFLFQVLNKLYLEILDFWIYSELDILPVFKFIGLSNMPEFLYVRVFVIFIFFVIFVHTYADLVHK